MDRSSVDVEQNRRSWFGFIDSGPAIVSTRKNRSLHSIVVRDGGVPGQVVWKNDLELLHVDPSHQAPAIELVRTSPLIAKLETYILLNPTRLYFRMHL